jgi:hypothetical protein
MIAGSKQEVEGTDRIRRLPVTGADPFDGATRSARRTMEEVQE